MILLRTKAKGTKSLRCNVLYILSFKQFSNLKGRNENQKRIIQDKRIQFKHAAC